MNLQCSDCPNLGLERKRRYPISRVLTVRGNIHSMTFILVKRTWPLGEKISIGTHVQPGIKAFSAKWSTSRILFNLPRFFSNSIDKWCFLNFNYIHCMKARLNNQKLHYSTHIFLVPLRKNEILKWTLEHCMTEKIKSFWNWHSTCKNCRSNWISGGKQSQICLLIITWHIVLYLYPIHLNGILISRWFPCFGQSFNCLSLVNDLLWWYQVKKNEVNELVIWFFFYFSFVSHYTIISRGCES